MTHGQIIAAIQDRARRRGVLSHHCPDSRRCDGDRGLPDLLLVGMFGAAWIEVKSPGDRLKPDQVTWKHALGAAGQVYQVVREGDLDDGGAVNMLLLFVSEGIAA